VILFPHMRVKDEARKEEDEPGVIEG
jgi:hypothetical protein